MAQGSTINVGQLFENAESLENAKREVMDSISGNRETLRNLDRAGLLSASERERLQKVYPPVNRTRKNKSGS